MTKFWSTKAKRVEPYIPGEQLNEPKIIKLNTNENPYPPSPAVVKAIENEVGENLRLYPSPTMDELREEIGTYYNVDKENIFVGNGSDEVLAFAFMAFFEPGEKVLFPAITYSFYPVYAKLFNITYEEVSLNDDFTINIEDYFNSEGGVIFPNPNAPTSLLLPIEQVEEIAKNNPEKVVIVDEAYVDFAPKGQSATTLVNKYDNILVIQTMSKSRALAGMRIGFAVGHESLIQALIRMKDSFNSYPVDRLALVAAKAAIEDQAYFAETNEQIINTRQWTTEKMEALGFTVLPSATNFIFTTHEKFDAETLYEKLKAENILIRYFGTKPIENYVRITIGTKEEMEKFIKAVELLLN